MAASDYIPVGAQFVPLVILSPALWQRCREQLGLKLESRKVPVDVRVVDHAELPSDN